MKTEKVIIDGIESEVVVELDSNYKNDKFDINLQDTIEIPIDEIKKDFEKDNKFGDNYE